MDGDGDGDGDRVGRETGGGREGHRQGWGGVQSVREVGGTETGREREAKCEVEQKKKKKANEGIPSSIFYFFLFKGGKGSSLEDM